MEYRNILPTSDPQLEAGHRIYRLKINALAGMWVCLSIIFLERSSRHVVNTPLGYSKRS
jgi:hypothetical protein